MNRVAAVATQRDYSVLPRKIYGQLDIHMNDFPATHAQNGREVVRGIHADVKSRNCSNVITLDNPGLFGGPAL